MKQGQMSSAIGRRVPLVAAGATALVAAAAAAAASVVTGLARNASRDAARRGWWTALDTTPPAALLTGLAAVVLLGCVGWLWVGVVVTLARVVAGAGGERARGVPAPLHRVLLAGCGLALAGGALAPAAAVPTPLHEEPRQVPVGVAPAPTPALGGTERGADTWVVRRGDTLWAIARASLGGTARPPSDHAIAARVRVLHRLNHRAVPDPDLIHPGRRLRLPSA